jgi:flavin-dependent dehydrogenase
MIENHTPKHGSHFHWSKDITKNSSLDDYYHVWSNRWTSICCFNFNMAKFERDVLKMVKNQGVKFYKGSVVDVDLTSKESLHVVKIKVDGEEKELKTKHLIDTVGLKTNNFIEDLDSNAKTGIASVRVKKSDRQVFDSGYHPHRASSSTYYATNHFFGHGHWLWMIPTDSEEMELSIGLVHHEDVIPVNKINTKEKFYNFLKANHNILYQVIKSGEEVEFNYRPQVSYKNKTMFSENNWYVIGDAAYTCDAFYSYGTSIIALAIESVTEIIRSKLTGEADAEAKRNAYNTFNLTYIDKINYIMQHSSKQLGHASVMSWRIYLEYMWWFGVDVPMYVGKWHLDLNFIDKFIKQVSGNLNSLFADIDEQFNQLVDRQDANLGLMDCYRGDQLIWGYYTSKHFDRFLENTKLEPRRCNVFLSMKMTYFYVAIWYALLQWKGFGLAGVFNLKHIYQFGSLLGLSIKAAMEERIYQSETKDLADNSQIAEIVEEFKNYSYIPEIQPNLDNKEFKSSLLTASSTILEKSAC